VVFQFTFAVVLIISTIVIRNQIRYAQERETGYSRNNLIAVDFDGDIAKNYPLIKQDLLNEGIASSVTKTMSAITQRGANSWGFDWEGKPSDFSETIALFSADAGLVKTAGLQLTAGRDIDIQRYPADSFAVLLNETAVKVMGFRNPVGQIIREPAENRDWKVVGVVKDYVIGSSYESIPPLVIEGPASFFNTIHIKFSASRSVADNLKKTEEIFNRYNPNYPFNYQFTDQEYARMFDAEQRTKTLAGLSAMMAIFISCLGLLGLSAYIAERRVKEIGVRKALGASVLNITQLLTLDFMKLVVAAIAIAIPVAWWAMNMWLEDFAYKVTINWLVFAFAGILAISITLLTVSFEVIRAAMADPVKSLRRE
jgi:ABC-type antimicrobial peptide transport system permease subunit